MKKILALSILAAAFLSACTNNDIDKTVKASLLRGTIEPATRTTLVAEDEGYALHWVTGDRISVSNGTASALYQASEGGSVTAEFTPVAEPLSGDSFTAVYPAELAEGILPAEQTYAENDITGMPMLAESGADATHLIFRPACGILRLNVTTPLENVEVAAIKLVADQPLAGTAVFSNGTLGVTDGTGTTLICNTGVAVGAAPTAFHIWLPAGSYTGLKIRILTLDSREYLLTLPENEQITFLRGELREMDIAVDALSAPTSDGKARLRPGTDFNEIIKNLCTPGVRSFDYNSTIRKIVFKVNEATRGDVLVSETGSEPVWASWDASTGTITVTTLADEIYTNEISSYMFCWLHALEAVEGLSCLNTSETVYFDHMFIVRGSEASPLKSLDLSSFDTRNAFTFASMFDSLVNLESVRVESFNTEKVESFANMFNWCKALSDVDVSGFDTRSAVTLAHMFMYCQKVTRLDVSGFDTHNVRSMESMFRYCSKLEEVDARNWNTDNLVNVSYFVQYCNVLKKLDMSGDGWKTGKITSAAYFINGTNTVEEMRLGKNVLFEALPSLTVGFYPGSGYIATTPEKPMTVWCEPAFAQKSLRSAPSMLLHTNQRQVVWKNIETDEPLAFDQEVGSMTSTVSVAGVAPQPQVIIEVNAGKDLKTAVAEAVAYEGEGEPYIRLQENVTLNDTLNLTNVKLKNITLDLNGHTLSTNAQRFITTDALLLITDSQDKVGKITSSQSKVVNKSANRGMIVIKNCIIESTKETAEGTNGWRDDPLIFHNNASASVLTITGSRITARGYLSVLSARNVAITNIIDSELSSGVDSEKGYYVLLCSGPLNVFSGSFYTRSNGTSSTAASVLHMLGATTARVYDGWFYAGGTRTVSGSYNKIVFNGGYLDKAPTNTSYVTYGEGKSLQALNPAVTHHHATTDETYSYAYQVK